MRLSIRQSGLSLAIGALVAAPATLAEMPVETAPNQSWISVSGTVEDVSPSAFELDYGDGSIVVEMDDWDHDADGYKLFDGDEVVVTGRVDADLFEARTIEASSVYVENLSTYFYASSADEEDAYVGFIVASERPGKLSVEGTVSSVGMGEFTLNTGLQQIDVDVSELGYDPLDDEGLQRINEGDRVSVTGEMGTEFLIDRDFVAKSIVTLRDRAS